MDFIQDVVQLCATLPLNVMCSVPCFEGRNSVLGGPTSMFSETRGSEGTKDKLICQKCKCSGTRSTSQKQMNCLMVPVYCLRVDSAQPAWMAQVMESLVCDESIRESLWTSKKEWDW